jgi:hypothetical protein
VVAGVTDSLFLHDNSDANCLLMHKQGTTTEYCRALYRKKCSERIGASVDHYSTFMKAAIIKKKDYFGVTTSGEIKLVRMEGKKMTDLHGLTKYLISSRP